MAHEEAGPTVGEARARYFADNGFDPEYRDRFIHVRLLGHSMPVFPNTKPRIAAARIHDLHHVATGYDTTWVGEGEIGGWELASGCGPYLAAWILNLAGFGIGCLISPLRVWRAFVRGRHSKNLYGSAFDPGWLASSVDSLRRDLALDGAVPEATTSDGLAFAGWVALGLLYAAAGVLSLPLFLLAMFKMPRVPQVAPQHPQPSSDRSAAPAE